MDIKKYHIEEWDHVYIPWGIMRRVSVARANAGPDRLGVVKICYPGDPDDVLLMSRRDFEHWFGKIPRGLHNEL